MENLIECNPKVILGKPVIKGTHVTVELILEKLATGESVEEILLQHPHLKREEVSSALRFAVQKSRDDFLPLWENQKIFEAINEAYADEPSADEMREIHFEIHLMENKVRRKEKNSRKVTSNLN